MITIRKSNERGHANHGWLDSYHTFSFADYHDPRHVHFRALRVINEDHIAGGGGFPTHPHRDMEIITYVVSGAVAHRDSTGGRGVIKAGELQHMSAGTGVEHSEANASPSEAVHLLQIWILPEKNGLKPDYGQTSLADLRKNGALTLVGSQEGGEHLLKINQDVRLFVGKLAAGEQSEHVIESGRYAWVQLIDGTLELNGQELRNGDAAGVKGEPSLRFVARDNSHFLLFDLG
jgi:redox-sensitive bicupin YhaK (pirin superfamily)